MFRQHPMGRSRKDRYAQAAVRRGYSGDSLCRGPALPLALDLPQHLLRQKRPYRPEWPRHVRHRRRRPLRSKQQRPAHLHRPGPRLPEPEPDHHHLGQESTQLPHPASSLGRPAHLRHRPHQKLPRKTRNHCLRPQSDPSSKLGLKKCGLSPIIPLFPYFILQKVTFRPSANGCLICT